MFQNSKVVLRLVAVSLLLCSFASAAPQKCPAPVTRLTTAKGEYSPQDGVTFGLQDFAARMVAVGKTSPLCYQRVTDIDHGEVFVSSQSLSHEFESKIQQSNDTKLSDLKVETKDHAVVMSGKMKKLIALPFTIEGPVSTDGSTLIFHATKIKAAGLEVKGLLDALGKHLSNMMQSESVSGVVVKGDTLIFQPEQIAHVKGHIEAANITPQGLLLKFGEAPKVKLAKK